jgi:hypothetical protein
MFRDCPISLAEASGQTVDMSIDICICSPWGKDIPPTEKMQESFRKNAPKKTRPA